VLVEPNPPECEYRDEYEMFYRHVHSTKASTCPTRLHFFLGDVATVGNVKQQDERYLGYCDVRPTPSRTLSCALIDERAFVPKGSQNHLFLICQKKFEVELGSKVVLSVNAFPYIQQDGHVIRCAQAALASIAMYYGSKDEGREMTGPVFTKLGASVPDGERQVPSRGLVVPQIGLGVARMGFEPVVYDWTKAPEGMRDLQHREQIIYRFLESRIPVVVGIKTEDSYHALVVIGHTFTPDTWQAEALGAYYRTPRSGLIDDYPAYHCSTNWVERFVIQDDNMGPYTLIPSDFLKYYACELVVAPLPPHIYLPPETAEAFVGWLLSNHGDHGDLCSELDEIIAEQRSAGVTQNKETEFWYNEFRTHVRSKEYVLRTSLRDSSQLKEEKLKSPCGDEYSEILRKADWPEKVWQVEISWPLIFTHSRRCCGEVILDPTTPFENSGLNQSWLWMHVPGIILSRSPINNTQRCVVLVGEDPISRHHFTLEIAQKCRDG